MSKARNLSDFISDATIDSTEIADLSVTHAKLHTDMNLSSKTLTFAANQISGNSVDGGVISNFASTGIDDNASATAVTILSDGKVGIGTNSPAVALEIIGTTTSGIRIKNNALHSNGFNIYVDSSTDTAVLNNPFSGPMLFETANTERMRVDNSGSLMVGKTSLGVSNLGFAARYFGTGSDGGTTIELAKDNATAMYLNRTSSNGTIIDFRKDGTTIGIIGVADASAKMSIIGTNENLQIGANGANVFNVSSTSVYPQTDNAIDVGFSASGNRFKDLHLSGAINQKNNTKIECINTQGNVGDLVFSTRYSTLGEKVRITGLGYLLVGKANASLASSNTGVVLNKNGVSSINSGSDTNMIFARAGTGTMIVFRANNVTTTGTISVSASSTAYNTSSDYRLKENVVGLTGASARVNQLNPSRFNFIADDTNTLVDGFLAHEVATVVPEAITGTKDAMKDEEYEVTPAVLDDDGNVTTEAVMGTRSVPDYQGIDQSKLVPLLTAALQEALTEIASLKTRVEALE